MQNFLIMIVKMKNIASSCGFKRGGYLFLFSLKNVPINFYSCSKARMFKEIEQVKE